jgi:peptide-methionine (S)-S-oxide reductase
LHKGIDIAYLKIIRENLQMSQAAYFATGCFWGAERRFWQLTGVTSTSVGYMGGNKSNPTYKEVCSGTTNHAEIVEVSFDPTTISFERLLAEFWVMHDPTSLNQQGGDIGTQYRSAIYATTPEQLDIALRSKLIYQKALTENGLGQIVTEIISAKGITYWIAEEYHQRYLEKNPNGYDCHSSTGIAYPLVTNTHDA